MGQFFTFQGIGNAQITERLPKFRDGFVGIVQIARTEVVRTRNAGDKLFVEVVVAESNDPGTHPVGQRYSWGQSLLDANVSGGALKSFLAAVAGVDVSDKDKMAQLEPQMDPVMTQAVAQPDNNALTGRYVRLETRHTKTQNNRDFIVHTWTPYT